MLFPAWRHFFPTRSPLPQPNPTLCSKAGGIWRWHPGAKSHLQGFAQLFFCPTFLSSVFGELIHSGHQCKAPRMLKLQGC